MLLHDKFRSKNRQDCVLSWATTKKRYSDTTIQRYTEPEPGAGATRKLFKLINYLINYCFQSPQETLVIVFPGGGGE